MPKGRKRFDAGIFISAAIISTLLFASGLFIGYSINNEKLTSIDDNIRRVTRDIQNFQIEFLFLDVLGENATCPLLAETLSGINKDSYEIGNKLESYGSESEIQDYNDYVNTKREYSRLLIGYWLLANKLKKTCRMEVDTIVYFYSKDCFKCDDQSFVLTYFKRMLNEKILIFTLDADLDEPSVQVIKKNYNITEYPSLVINGGVYTGYQSKADLERTLNL
jgi:hypothetical protein